MSWAVQNAHDENSASIPDIDFNSPDVLTDPASFYHPLTEELTNGNRVSGMVSDLRNRMLADDHSGGRWDPVNNNDNLATERGVFSLAARESQPLGFVPTGPLFCQWRITVAMGERIYLNFTYLEIFQEDDRASMGGGLAISRNSGKMTCSNNYVEVRDGYYSGSPLIGT